MQQAQTLIGGMKSATKSRQRFEPSNESQIVGLRMELAMWTVEDRRLSERLRFAALPGHKRVWQLEACLLARSRSSSPSRDSSSRFLRLIRSA